MIRNYFLVALRNITKNKFYAAINLIGLVIGIACCLLIFVYIQDELSYDKFHTDADKIYRVGLHGKIAGQEVQVTSSSMPVGPTMQEEIPGIETTVRVLTNNTMTFKVEDIVLSQERVFYADSNFFQFFTFPLLHGDVATALKEPNSMVITTDLAKKYFGDNDPIGQTILVGNDRKAHKVTGVTAPVPSNSHIYYSAVISLSTIINERYSGWTGNSMETYVKKNPQTTVESVNTKLEDIVERYVGKELEQGLGINFDEFRKNGGIYAYFIYPMTDTHLYSTLEGDPEPGGDIRYVYIFGGVGVFILLIACINFMNLSTARSAGRAKEVGLRKTLGSQRSQMILQFLSESFIYSVVAVLVALGLSYWLLPQFNLLSGKTLTLSVLTQPTSIMAIVALLVLVGLLAGSYPAFYLTSFNAVEVLKGKLRAGMKSKGVRITLVVVQFVLSTLMIIATVVVFKQLSYMQSKQLGLDQHHLINVRNTRALGEGRKAFKNEVENLAGVELTSYSSNKFPGVNNTTVFKIRGSEADYLAGKYYADWDQLNVLKFELVQGRFFSREFSTDTLACVLNEAAVKEFGLEDPLNQYIIDYNDVVPDTMKVVGVVGDFNFESLKTNIRPMLIRLTDIANNLVVRYEGDPQEMISSIEELWKTTAPGEPFEYTFVDDDFDALFKAEMRLRDLFIVFSSLAIAIACLGLFALAAFTTEQRTKEIGIRKALGASSITVAGLLSREFTKLVLIAIIPAVAIGWYGSSWWLENFAYRAQINPLIFVGCGVLAIVIAWLTVAYQSVKAASSNPVKALRYE